MNNLPNKMKDPREALKLFGIETPDIQFPFSPEVDAAEAEGYRDAGLERASTSLLPDNYNDLAQAEANSMEEQDGVIPSNLSSSSQLKTSMSMSSPSQEPAPSKESDILARYKEMVAQREKDMDSARGIDNSNQFNDSIMKGSSKIANALANVSGRTNINNKPESLLSNEAGLAESKSGRGIEAVLTEYKMKQQEEAAKLAAQRAASDDKYKNEMLQLQRDKLSSDERIAAAKANSKGGGETTFQKDQSKALGKQSASYYGQDRDQLISNSNKLNTAIGLIDSAKSGPVSGSVRGLLPDVARKISNPEAMEVQQAIQSAITDTLRPTLGAQFTEGEGKRIMDLQYDPQATPAENKRRATELKKVLDTKVKATDALYEHLGKGGKLVDFDFDKYGMRASEPSESTSTPANLDSKIDSFMKKNNIKDRAEAERILKENGKL